MFNTNSQKKKLIYPGVCVRILVSGVPVILPVSGLFNEGTKVKLDNTSVIQLKSQINQLKINTLQLHIRS